MNERIYELIRQSAVPADRAESYALAKGLIEPTEKLDVAKFAELIVRECAGIYDKIDNGNLHMGTDDYLEALHKTFFGVKE